MDTLGKLKEIATAIGAFASLFGLLALVVYFAGVTNPVFTALRMFGYIAIVVVLIFGVGIGIMFGRDLWESKAAWKKIVGGVIVVVSATIGIAFALYVYSGIDSSDCPTGVPLRYC